MVRQEGAPSRRVIVRGLFLAAAVVAAQAATQLIDFGVFDLRIAALNCDKRASVFGVASLLAQAAFAAASAWRAGQVEGRRWAWRALGGLVAALVLIRGLMSYDAEMLAMPLACMFCLSCWLTWRDPGAARAVVWAGLGLMVVSLMLHQVGLDADASTASDYTWAYQIEGVLKHGCELAGWILLATGLIAGHAQEAIRARR